jgi:hypothetical protein
MDKIIWASQGSKVERSEEVVAVSVASAVVAVECPNPEMLTVEVLLHRSWKEWNRSSLLALRLHVNATMA